MIRRPPRSTPLYSSAASDVYKRQAPFSVIREREGWIGKEVLLLDLLGSHLRELLPGGAAQAGRRTDRNRLPPGHQSVSCRCLEIVSRRQERGVGLGALLASRYDLKAA